MTKLSPTQRGLLEAAALDAEGVADAAGHTGSTIAMLIKRGWLLSIPKSEGGSRLLITTSGRTAIGAKPATPEPPLPLKPAAASTAPIGKLEILIELLRRPAGVRIGDMTAATGWQAHSVRGAISGALKKGRGLSISSEKTDSGRLYRIVAEPAA